MKLSTNNQSLKSVATHDCYDFIINKRRATAIDAICTIRLRVDNVTLVLKVRDTLNNRQRQLPKRSCVSTEESSRESGSKRENSIVRERRSAVLWVCGRVRVPMGGKCIAALRVGCVCVWSEVFSLLNPSSACQPICLSVCESVCVCRRVKLYAN